MQGVECQKPAAFSDRRARRRGAALDQRAGLVYLIATLFQGQNRVKSGAESGKFA